MWANNENPSYLNLSNTRSSGKYISLRANHFKYKVFYHDYLTQGKESTLPPQMRKNCFIYYYFNTIISVMFYLNIFEIIYYLLW